MAALPKTIPRFCFNCGAAIVPGRRHCLRCNTTFEATPDEAIEIPRGGLPQGTQVLERYVIEAALSVSRMHIVYQAWDQVLERNVALRTLREAGSNRRAELRHQARLQNALEHPNIVATLDFVEDRQLGLAAVIEEYTGRRCLRDWMKGGEQPQLPFAVYRQLMLPMVAAVAHAHRHGVVHRNLKPRKVLLDAMDRPKISDFGMLQYAARDQSRGMPLVVGTLEYQAPEQARNPMEAVASNDIYSLGVIFYEMVSGQLPIEGKNDIELLDRLMHAAPTPLLSHVPNVIAGLDGVIMRCLEKDPQVRYPSADALYLALADVLGAPVYVT